MFKTGDFIVYGNSGVCKVENVGKLNLPGIPEDKLYYTLLPIYSQGSKIFTPVNNDKVIMRPVVSREEGLNLINEINSIECLWITDEKKKDQVFKESFDKCDLKELVKIIKTIYMNQKSRIMEGKKITTSDEKLYRTAQDRLYGELAITFEMDKEEAKQYVIDRVDGLDE